MIRDRFFHERRAGFKPRPVFLRRLKRCHPRVRVVWNRRHDCWLLVERARDGKLHVIARLAEHPNLATIQFLNRAQAVARFSEQEIRNWLEHQDTEERKAMSSDSATVSAMLEEGSERLWHEIGTDHTVAMGDRNGTPTARK